MSELHEDIFTGKTVIVTGAGSGIGRATAELFASQGASVVIADRDGESATAVASTMERAIPFTVDVSVAAQVQELMKETEARFGAIDVLVNNAGYGFAGTVATIAEEDWDRLMSVNLKGVFLCSKYALPALSRARGAIVNVTSYTATVAIAGRAAYVASKGAISALTRAMAIDHIREGVRVNAVAPGTVDSPYFTRMLAESPNPEALRAELNGRTPIDRMAEPREIAEAIVWLASDRARFAIGSVLTVDGGSSIWGR